MMLYHEEVVDPHDMRTLNDPSVPGVLTEASGWIQVQTLLRPKPYSDRNPSCERPLRPRRPHRGLRMDTSADAKP
eukprot:3200145-Pyramimonas_sp.AAC.1